MSDDDFLDPNEHYMRHPYGDGEGGSGGGGRGGDEEGMDLEEQAELDTLYLKAYTGMLQNGFYSSLFFPLCLLTYLVRLDPAYEKIEMRTDLNYEEEGQGKEGEEEVNEENIETDAEAAFQKTAKNEKVKFKNGIIRVFPSD